MLHRIERPLTEIATLISAASRSSLPRVVGTPIYQSMTIRNWNTTVKLVDLTRDS